MRRLTLSPLPSRRRAVAIWPAAVAGSIALTLAAEHAAHAAPPEPALTVLPPAPRGIGVPAIAAVTAPTTYTVKSGDTVWGIARAHGLDTAAVLAANGLTPDSLIRPGQVLALTPAATLAPPAPAAPEAAPRSHEVRPGDTVSAIARANGVSLDAVLSANALTRASIIYPGDVLQIPSGSPAPAPAAVAPATAPGLDAEQSENARLIIRIGRELGVSDRGILIALGTAMQESWLRNLDWGDRDSLGLFQQCPSTGWGTPAQLTDAAHATRLFFGGRTNPNVGKTRGLLDVRGWSSMSLTDAAQAVQLSAHPTAYAKWEAPARTWLSTLG